MNNLIFENKNKIIQDVTECIYKDDMNLLLLGIIPENFIDEVINLYYNIKYKCEYEREKYNENILFIDGFNDINSSICNNLIHNFSKKVNIKKKFVVIFNFDNFSDILQSGFKNYINKNIFYIFCSKTINKIYETIVTRTNHIIFEKLSYENINIYINNLCNYYNIQLSRDDKNIIVEKDMTIQEIKNVFNYIRLLKKSDIKEILDNLYCIDKKNIECYFKKIENNDLKGSINILFEIYERGYSLIDIYFFIYEYIKNNINNTNNNVIHLIAYYINKIYEGYDSKLSLVFFTNDCIKSIFIK